MARGGGVDLIGVGEAAELLAVSTARLRQLPLPGRFIAEAQVVSGRRLYRRRDVLAFKRAREQSGQRGR